uniref:NAB co-repressor domain-containing protein n=1 Tax=Meloidogyne javanica TaxID=6303 RepID=A0A915LN28_MELJA
MSFSPPPNTPPSSGGVLFAKEAKEEPEQINCNEEENTTLIQNQKPKKRLERSLMEALALPQDDPLRVENFRLFSRFYGRFEAKRRSDRTLTRHECVVNESAAQLFSPNV